MLLRFKPEEFQPIIVNEKKINLDVGNKILLSTVVSTTTSAIIEKDYNKNISMLKQDKGAKSNNITKLGSDKEYGVWIWNSAVTMSDLEMDIQINKAKSYGFNVIYMSVDDVFAHEKNKYNLAFSKFIKKANNQGIEVDAVAGDKKWAKPENRNKGYLIIDYVIDYNKNNTKFRGFQFDVEPYLLTEYESNKRVVLSQFIDFINLSAQKLINTDLRFSIVIPHFYDSAVGWTPVIEFKGSKNYTYEHLLGILDNNNNSSIIVMSYRNFFDGKNGIREISDNEISKAGKTKVIVAQETGNHEPHYITYFGKNIEDLNGNVAKIFSSYNQSEGFGGVAIHNLNTLNNLKSDLLNLKY